MTDDLEAQARKLTAACLWAGPAVMAHGSGGVACVDCITAWARRLLAESRAGALREARTAVAEADDFGSAYEAVRALARAAEAEPGTQDRAGKEGA